MKYPVTFTCKCYITSNTDSGWYLKRQRGCKTGTSWICRSDGAGECGIGSSVWQEKKVHSWNSEESEIWALSARSAFAPNSILLNICLYFSVIDKVQVINFCLLFFEVLASGEHRRIDLDHFESYFSKKNAVISTSFSSKHLFLLFFRGFFSLTFFLLFFFFLFPCCTCYG